MTNWRPLEKADLTPELIGQKVRFNIFIDINDTEIEGIDSWNESSNRFTIDGVIGDGITIPDFKEGIFHYSRFDIEVSKFAGVKVGMYAHLNNGDYQRITAVKKTAIHCDLDCYAMLNGKHIRQRNLEIVEIIPAKDVIVDFGAFRGTVSNGNRSSDYFDIDTKGHWIRLYFDMLTPEKQSEVKELLEAIEKESK